MSRRRRPAQIVNSRSPLLRSELVAAVACLITDEGLDYGFAKRKAVRQLGLPANFPLPGNAEIEDAVREYRAMTQDEAHDVRLFGLRLAAIDLMRRLARFSPWLTGSVLEGNVGPHSRIDLLLYPDSSKEVEIFLLDHGIPFHHGKPRSERVEAVLVIDDEQLPANLVILAPRDERVAIKGGEGRTRTRARLPQVERLVAHGDVAGKLDNLP